MSTARSFGFFSPSVLGCSACILAKDYEGHSTGVIRLAVMRLQAVNCGASMNERSAFPTISVVRQPGGRGAREEHRSSIHE